MNPPNDPNYCIVKIESNTFEGMNKGQTMIAVSELSRTYIMGTEGVHALRSVTLEIVRNEYVALMGPSGSGKSLSPLLSDLPGAGNRRCSVVSIA